MVEGWLRGGWEVVERRLWGGWEVVEGWLEEVEQGEKVMVCVCVCVCVCICRCFELIFIW